MKPMFRDFLRSKFALVTFALLISLLPFIPAAPAQASCPPWVCPPPPPPPTPNWSFETGDFTSWTVQGNAFTVTNQTNWGWGGDFNFKGTYHVWGAKNGDGEVGTLRSLSFTTSQQGYVDFLIGGGDDINNAYVALVDEATGQELFKATGTNSELYRRVIWSVPGGKTLYFKVVDNATGGWGHINADDFHTPAYTVASSDYTHLANHNFEFGDLRGWAVESGNAFSAGDVTSEGTYWGGPFNQEGTYHLWGFKEGGDADTGVLASLPFTLGGLGQVDFLISGGNNPDNLYVTLVRASDGKELFKATGSNSEQYSRVSWDAATYIGDVLYIKVIDRATNDWGHINIDDVNVQVKPQTELPNHEFNNLLDDWTVVSGDAFSVNDITQAVTWSNETFWSKLSPNDNEYGDYHLWGYKDGGDGQVGVLQSNTYTLHNSGNWMDNKIEFLISGGNDIDHLYVALVRASDGAELLKATGSNSEQYSRVTWDISNYLEETCYMKVVDNATGSWGHINLDDVRGAFSPFFTNGSFEFPGRIYGWNIVSGDAFSLNDITTDTYWDGMFYQSGRTSASTAETSHLWGYKDGGDGQVGVLKSRNFILGSGVIDYLIGGGNDINNLYVALVRASDGAELYKATGSNSDTYTRVTWDPSAYAETECYIKVVDNATGAWGHVNLDDVNVPALYIH